MKKILSLRIVSFLTLFAFLSADLGKISPVWANITQPLAESPSVPFQINLPAKLGKIETLHSGSGPSIIHIQEAHGNDEAQQKIFKMLKHFRKAYGIKTVFVEGSAFKLHPELVRFFPGDLKRTLHTLDLLTKKSYAGASELFLASEKEAQIYGIENLDAYVANGRDFVAVKRSQVQTEEFLNDLGLQIKRLTASFMNANLRQFLKQNENYEAHIMSVSDWIRLLRAQAEKELSLDLKNPVYQIQWPMLLRMITLEKLEKELDLKAFEKEREEFLAVMGTKQFLMPRPYGDGSLYQQIKALLTQPFSHHPLPHPQTSEVFQQMVLQLPRDFRYADFPNVNRFIGHLILQSELSGKDLHEEIEKLTSKIAEKMAQTVQEKELIEISRQFRLYKKLFALELTPEEYEAVIPLTEPSDFVSTLQKFNSSQRFRPIKFKRLSQMDVVYRQALAFYRGTKERDKWMLENIEKRLKEDGGRWKPSTVNPQPPVVIITGGFHAQPFENYFKTKNYNYALITPQIKIDRTNNSYSQVFLENFLDLSAKPSAIKDIPYAAMERAEIRDHARNPDVFISVLKSLFIQDQDAPMPLHRAETRVDSQSELTILFEEHKLKIVLDLFLDKICNLLNLEKKTVLNLMRQGSLEITLNNEEADFANVKYGETQKILWINSPIVPLITKLKNDQKNDDENVVASIIRIYDQVNRDFNLSSLSFSPTSIAPQNNTQSAEPKKAFDFSQIESDVRQLDKEARAAQALEQFLLALNRNYKRSELGSAQSLLSGIEVYINYVDSSFEIKVFDKRFPSALPRVFGDKYFDLANILYEKIEDETEPKNIDMAPSIIRLYEWLYREPDLLPRSELRTQDITEQDVVIRFALPSHSFNRHIFDIKKAGPLVAVNDGLKIYFYRIEKNKAKLLDSELVSRTSLRHLAWIPSPPHEERFVVVDEKGFFYELTINSNAQIETSKLPLPNTVENGGAGLVYDASYETLLFVGRVNNQPYPWLINPHTKEMTTSQSLKKGLKGPIRMAADPPFVLNHLGRGWVWFIEVEKHEFWIKAFGYHNDQYTLKIKERLNTFLTEGTDYDPSNPRPFNIAIDPTNGEILVRTNNNAVLILKVKEGRDPKLELVKKLRLRFHGNEDFWAQSLEAWPQQNDGKYYVAGHDGDVLIFKLPGEGDHLLRQWFSSGFERTQRFDAAFSNPGTRVLTKVDDRGAVSISLQDGKPPFWKQLQIPHNAFSGQSGIDFAPHDWEVIENGLNLPGEPSVNPPSSRQTYEPYREQVFKLSQTIEGWAVSLINDQLRVEKNGVSLTLKINGLHPYPNTQDPNRIQLAAYATEENSIQIGVLQTTSAVGVFRDPRDLAPSFWTSEFRFEDGSIHALSNPQMQWLDPWVAENDLWKVRILGPQHEFASEQNLEVTYKDPWKTKQRNFFIENLDYEQTEYLKLEVTAIQHDDGGEPRVRAEVLRKLKGKPVMEIKNVEFGFDAVNSQIILSNQSSWKDLSAQEQQVVIDQMPPVLERLVGMAAYPSAKGFLFIDDRRLPIDHTKKFYGAKSFSNWITFMHQIWEKPATIADQIFIKTEKSDRGEALTVKKSRSAHLTLSLWEIKLMPERRELQISRRNQNIETQATEHNNQITISLDDIMGYGVDEKTGVLKIYLRDAAMQNAPHIDGIFFIPASRELNYGRIVLWANPPKRSLFRRESSRSELRSAKPLTLWENLFTEETFRSDYSENQQAWKEAIGKLNPEDENDSLILQAIADAARPRTNFSQNALFEMNDALPASVEEKLENFLDTRIKENSEYSDARSVDELSQSEILFYYLEDLHRAEDIKALLLDVFAQSPQHMNFLLGQFQNVYFDKEQKQFQIDQTQLKSTVGQSLREIAKALRQGQYSKIEETALREFKRVIRLGYLEKALASVREIEAVFPDLQLKTKLNRWFSIETDAVRIFNDPEITAASLFRPYLATVDQLTPKERQALLALIPKAALRDLQIREDELLWETPKDLRDAPGKWKIYVEISAEQLRLQLRKDKQVFIDIALRNDKGVLRIGAGHVSFMPEALRLYSDYESKMFAYWMHEIMIPFYQGLQFEEIKMIKGPTDDKDFERLGFKEINQEWVYNQDAQKKPARNEMRAQDKVSGISAEQIQNAETMALSFTALLVPISIKESYGDAVFEEMVHRLGLNDEVNEPGPLPEPVQRFLNSSEGQQLKQFFHRRPHAPRRRIIHLRNTDKILEQGISTLGIEILYTTLFPQTEYIVVAKDAAAKKLLLQRAQKYAREKLHRKLGKNFKVVERRPHGIKDTVERLLRSDVKTSIVADTALSEGLLQEMEQIPFGSAVRIMLDNVQRLDEAQEFSWALLEGTNDEIIHRLYTSKDLEGRFSELFFQIQAFARLLQSA